MNNRAGKYISNLKGEMEYFSFLPTPLPPEPKIIYDNELIDCMISATSNISVLNNVAKLLDNFDMYLALYVQKEALLSSQIEGTQATIEDVFSPQADRNKSRDIEDIVNYIKAYKYATKKLQKLPLCNRLLCETHEVLLSNTRGNDKNPGEFRRSQNWIGPDNCTIKDAKFIPPNVENMNKCMSDLEKFINCETETNYLINASLIHYQFETIHPFLDGNGRIGRLLTILYLIDKKVLDSPSLYISYYLKVNKIEYFDRINEVRRTGNYEQWTKFFLRAIAKSAEDAVQTIYLFNNLHISNNEKVQKSHGSSKNLQFVFEYIEHHPITDIKSAAKDLGLSYNTVACCVQKLVDCNILVKTNKAKRNRTYEYKDLLDLLRPGT